MLPTILLYDLDGTLCDTGGAGRRAMERAFGVVTGRTDACAGFRLGGMTDRLIARLGLQAVGHHDGEQVIDQLLDVYLDVLPDEIDRAAAACRVMPGVEAALDASHATPGVAVGLGTGNLRRGAEIKLRRVGLHGRFDFGGFGCDHEDRAELLRAGVRRGAERLGAPPEECRVVVIGDTPRDVEAARALGAECVAVATGTFGLDALRDAGAERPFPDLAAPGALEAILGDAVR